MINVPVFELMKIWGELVECYHGVNGYGGNTAEIYSYRLMRYSPLVHTDALTSFGAEEKRNLQGQAASDLHEICRLFWVEYGIKNMVIKIDGRELGDWLPHIGYGFDHRAHVEVIRR